MVDTQVNPRQSWETRTATSRKLFEKAHEVLPDGVSSPVRGSMCFNPYPLYIAEGTGCRIKDVDDNVYLDVLMAFGPVILGHANPAVTKAVQDQAAKGLVYGSCTPLEIEVATKICEMAV